MIEVFCIRGALAVILVNEIHIEILKKVHKNRADRQSGDCGKVFEHVCVSNPFHLEAIE